MKIKVSIFILAATLFVSFVAMRPPSYEIGLLKYNGGGDWYANLPTSLSNLVRFCNENLNTNFDAEQKIIEVEARDHVRNFQPPISGEEIMRIYNLGPCREIGQLKESIKQAILDGEIANDYNEAYAYMLNKAEKMKLKINVC